MSTDELRDLARRLLLDGDTDPHPHWRTLRERAPMLAMPEDEAWLLTDFASCRRALSDPRLGKPEADTSSGTLLARLGTVPLPPAMRVRSFVFMNPPEHTRLRSIAQAGLRPARIDALREAVALEANRAVEDLLAEPGVDVVDGPALELPLRVMTRLLGLPSSDAEELMGPFRAQRQMLVRMTAAAAGEDILNPPAIRATVAAVAAEVRSRRGRRSGDRGEPSDDLIGSILGPPPGGGQPLERREAIAMLVAIFMAGVETSQNMLANALGLLAVHPDAWAQLQAEPAIVGGAAEELLRFESPSQIDARFALEDVELDGVSFPAGTRVFTGLGAANRDPAVFDDPDRLDLRRRSGPTLTFSGGAHYCLGAGLARLESTAFLTALTERVRTITLCGDALRWRPTVVSRGLEDLQVELVAR